MVINVYYVLDRKHTNTVIIISMLHNILPHVWVMGLVCTQVSNSKDKLPKDPSLTEYCAKNIHNIPVS